MKIIRSAKLFQKTLETCRVKGKTIGFVPTKANGGNSTAELSYQYTDKNPPRRGMLVPTELWGGAYYRLKQVDLDGRFNYSNIVFIKGESVTELVLSSLFPNPAKDKLNVCLEAPAAQRVQLVVTDLAGRLVQQQTLQLQKGTNNQTLNVTGLAKGSYVIKVIGSSSFEKIVSKFVKE